MPLLTGIGEHSCLLKFKSSTYFASHRSHSLAYNDFESSSLEMSTSESNVVH